jgi:hypothetical protein
VAIQPFIPDQFGFITPIIAGQSWPKANEDDYAAAAQGYSDAIASLIATSSNSLLSADAIHLNVDSVSVDAFQQYWDGYVGQLKDSDKKGLMALINQYEQLAQQALSARNSTEYTKLVINIQIVITAIQLIIMAISAFFTFGASIAEAGPLIEIAQFVSRNIYFRLVQEIAMAALPDFLAESIQLLDLHHTDSYDGGRLMTSLFTGAIGGGLGMGANLLTTRLAGASSPLWRFIGNQAHQWYGRTIEGAVNNVLTTGLMDSGKLLNGQMTNDDWQALAFAGINGGFTGTVFHIAGSLGGHSTATVLFKTQDGTVYRGREVSPGEFRFFTDQGWLSSTGRLNPDGTLDVTGFWDGDKTSVPLSTMEVTDGKTTTTLTIGEDGQLVPRQSVIVGDGRTPYLTPAGDGIPLAKGDQLTVHYGDTPVEPGSGHTLVTETVRRGDPIAHTVTNSAGTRIYDATGRPVATRTADGFETTPGFTATTTRITLGQSPTDAVVTTFHDGDAPVLTVTEAGQSIALTAGDTLPKQADAWRLAALDEATAATVVQVGVLTALAHDELALNPQLRDALALPRPGEPIEVEQTGAAQRLSRLTTELGGDADPARADLRRQVLEAAGKLESATTQVSDRVAQRTVEGVAPHEDRLALVAAGDGLAQRSLDGLRAAYRDLVEAPKGSLAEIQARTALDRALTLADQTRRALADLSDHLGERVQSWQHLGLTVGPDKFKVLNPAYDHVFSLDDGRAFLKLPEAERGTIVARDQDAILQLRAWAERSQRERLAAQLARVLQGLPPTEEREPAVRAKAFVLNDDATVLTELTRLLPRDTLKKILSDPEAPMWTAGDPLPLAIESGMDQVMSMPTRFLRDGTPITDQHLQNRRRFLELQGKLERATAQHERDPINNEITRLKRVDKRVENKYWPYSDTTIGMDLVAADDPQAWPTVHTGSLAEQGIVLRRVEVAQQVVRVAGELQSLIHALAGDPDPTRIGQALDDALARDVVSPELHQELTRLRYATTPDPQDLRSRVKALIARGDLTTAQGVLLLGVSGDAPTFHAEIDGLTAAGVPKPVLDALHATGLAHGIDEVVRTDPNTLTRAELLAPLFAEDPRTVLRGQIEKIIARWPDVQRLLDPTGDPRVPLRGFDETARRAVYEHLVNSLIDTFNRYPPELLPELPVPIDPLTQQPADPSSMQYRAWHDVVDSITDGRWRGLRTMVHELHKQPGTTYGPRNHDAETKLFYTLARIFEDHPPAPDIELVITADKAMCAGCKIAGGLLAERYGVRITVVDPPGEVDVLNSGLAINGKHGHGEVGNGVKIPVEAGVINLLVHATADGLMLNGEPLRIEDLLALVPPESIPDDAVLRFLSCDLGQNEDLLRRLADVYGRPVVAADRTVWIDERGNVVASSMVTTQFGTVPYLDGNGHPDGHWKMALPGQHDLVVDQYVPAAAPEITSSKHWAAMLAGDHDSTVDETLRRLAKLEVQLQHLPIEHAQEIARINQAGADARRTYDEAVLRIGAEALEAEEAAKAHLAAVEAAAEVNKPPPVDPDAPPLSFITSSADLAHQLQVLHEQPLELVRQSIDAVQALLKQRAELVQKLTTLAARPARELTPEQAVVAEQSMRAVPALDDRIRSVQGDPRFQNRAVEQRVREALPPGSDPELAVRTARLRTADATSWKPLFHEQSERDLSQLLAQERDLSARLEVSRDLAELRRRVGHEAAVVWVDRQALRNERAALRRQISDQINQLRTYHQEVRTAASRLRHESSGGDNPIRDFLSQLGPPPIDPTELTALRQLTDRGLSTWDAEVERVRLALAQTLKTPANDMTSPRFAPAELAGATKTDWKPLALPRRIPTSVRAHAVPLPEHRSAEIGPYGEAIPRNMRLLAKDHLDGWRSVLQGIGHGDLLGVLKGITGASRREIEPIRLEERTVTVDKASWREVRTVYRITENRGSLAFPYTRKSRDFQADLVRQDLGVAQVKVKFTARERVQFIPSGGIRIRWERSVVERTLIDDPAKKGFAPYQRVVYDGAPEVSLFEHPSIEVKSMLRAAGEVTAPLSPLGTLGPQLGARIAIESMHTETVPLVSTVEARTQFAELAGQLIRAPGTTVTEAGHRLWQDALHGTLDASGKQHLDAELYFFVKQTLLGDTAVKLGQTSLLPFENFREFRVGHQWFTWSLRMPESATGPVRAISELLGTVITHGQELATNPVRLLRDMAEQDLPQQLLDHMSTVDDDDD